MFGIYLSQLVGAFVVFGWLTLVSADLAVDRLGTSVSRLPPVSQGFALLMERGKMRAMYPWQIWFRWLFDGLFTAAILAMPVLAWVPGREPELGLRVLWTVVGILEVLWLIHLWWLPRDPRESRS